MFFTRRRLGRRRRQQQPNVLELLFSKRFRLVWNDELVWRMRRVVL
jgi:hypothetical protein